MSPEPIRLVTNSPDETLAMAEALGGVLRAGDVLALVGTLGAGKTCLVRGLARGLGVGGDRPVISPTFVLLRSYPGRLTLNHYDAYRLDGPADMEEIGCWEVFESGGVTAIEWADHVAECLPADHVTLRITVAGPTRREFELAADGRDELARALAPWRRDD